MEWAEGRLTKRSEDSVEAPETPDAIIELAYTGADKLELASAREKILELMYEIEALKREPSGSNVERLKAELSVSYATNRGFRQQWEDERKEWEDEKKENEKLNAALKEKLNAVLKHERVENANAALKHEENEREENEKLNAALKHEREENEKLNAALKHEREENEKLKREREENANAALKDVREENANAALKHEREENGREENEKLNAALKHGREENEKLNAALKVALLENDNLIELTRSLREQADGLRAIVEIIADHFESGPCPLLLPEIIDGDDGEVVTDDLAA
jgi:hypothetical protein